MKLITFILILFLTENSFSQSEMTGAGIAAGAAGVGALGGAVSSGALTTGAAAATTTAGAGAGAAVTTAGAGAAGVGATGAGAAGVVAPAGTAAAGTAATGTAAKTATANSWSSWAVLAASSVGAVYSGTLYQAASKQVDDCEHNIKKLDELLAAFKEASSKDCVDGRSDLKKPECYCYNEDGTQNTNRSNSQTCKDEWAKRNYMLAMDKESFKSDSSTDVSIAGCVTTTGQFDEGCKCKRMVNSKGENACKKTPVSVNLPSSLGTTLGTKTATSDLLKFTNGLIGANSGSLSYSSLNTKAVSGKKLLETTLGKLDDQTKAKLPPANMTLEQANKIAQKLLGDKAFKNAANSSGTNLAVERPKDAAISKALEEAAKKAGLELSGTGKGIAKKTEENKNQNFSFSDSSSVASNGGNAVEFAEKTYNYKQGEITKDAGASIFEIISHRYIESGIRRLFEDEVK